MPSQGFFQRHRGESRPLRRTWLSLCVAAGFATQVQAADLLTITRDALADKLVVERATQKTIEGWKRPEKKPVTYINPSSSTLTS